MADTPATDQAPAQSVVDRIASAFGIQDDQPEDPAAYDGRPEQVASDEEEASPEEAAPESEEVEVEYNGGKYHVPKDLEPAIMQHRRDHQMRIVINTFGTRGDIQPHMLPLALD